MYVYLRKERLGDVKGITLELDDLLDIPTVIKHEGLLYHLTERRHRGLPLYMAARFFNHDVQTGWTFSILQEKQPQ